MGERLPLPIRLRPPLPMHLITDMDETIDNYCSPCLFLHDSPDCSNYHNNSNEHLTSSSSETSISRPTSRNSNISTYSDRTSSNLDFFGSTKALTAHVRRPVIATSPQRKPALRRKRSPTDVSLRDLNLNDSRTALIRQRRSEERLQRVYEEQILAYLESPLSEMGFCWL